MFEFVLYRVEFDNKHRLKIDKRFTPVIYSTLEEALMGQSYYKNQEYIYYPNGRHYEWYIEHRIKL